MKFTSFLAVSTLAVSTAAFSQSSESKIVVAANSISGSYEKMLGEIIGACSDDKFSITQAPGVTGGVVGNLEALVNNKAQAAMVRSDVFTAISQADASYKRFQTLVTLYAEPLHVLVLRDSKTKKKGTFEFGKTQFNSVADLKGYAIGAGGGVVYTLKILKGQGGAGYDIVQMDDSKTMLEALDKGDVAAIAFMGVAPLPALLKLDKTKYKLIPVNDSIYANVKGIYKTQTVNYSGLSDGPVYTVASNLVVLTRKFSTPEKVAAQRNFRECFYRNLDNLKDNGAPGWQMVEKGDRGVLDWYEIPAK
jgi:TRAP-type uncharacterized transport system substrate-binding protein